MRAMQAQRQIATRSAIKELFAQDPGGGPSMLVEKRVEERPLIRDNDVHAGSHVENATAPRRA